MPAELRALLATALCAAAALAAGCGSGSNDKVVKDRDVVFFERSGGFEGRTASLSVAPDGRATTSPPKKVTHLRPDAVRELRRAVARARIGELRKVSRPRQTPADGYQYTVSAGGETIQAEDGAVPRRLRPLLARLNRLLPIGG